MITVSVVIPTYNRAELLAIALASVAGQSRLPHEVIVVDDCSTEDIAAVVAACQIPCRYVRGLGRGPGQARNVGVEAATGRFIAFLDSDDAWSPYVIETVCGLLEEAAEGKAPLIYANAINFNHPNRPPALPGGPLIQSRHATLLEASPSISVATSRLVAIERIFFLGNDGFWRHPWNSEDTDFALRVGQGRPFIFIESPVLVAQRIHPGQISAAYEKYFNGMSEIVRREKAGEYLPLPHLARRRITWICCHARSCCWYTARFGGYKMALELYIRTFRWNCELLRVPFLVSFPVFWLASVLTRSRSRRKPGV